VSNPPFHFEHENNIEVALNLFSEVQNCLKLGGRFVLVANKHLNYKTHLDKLFCKTEVLAENKKFVIYECLKN
ncbi:MAG: methyltransferase, partial [Polaribacter sp.]